MELVNEWVQLSMNTAQIPFHFNQWHAKRLCCTLRLTPSDSDHPLLIAGPADSAAPLLPPESAGSAGAASIAGGRGGSRSGTHVWLIGVTQTSQKGPRRQVAHIQRCDAQ